MANRLVKIFDSSVTDSEEAIAAIGEVRLGASHFCNPTVGAIAFRQKTWSIKPITYEPECFAPYSGIKPFLQKREAPGTIRDRRGL